MRPSQRKRLLVGVVAAASGLLCGVVVGELGAWETVWDVCDCFHSKNPAAKAIINHHLFIFVLLIGEKDNSKDVGSTFQA